MATVGDRIFSLLCGPSAKKDGFFAKFITVNPPIFFSKAAGLQLESSLTVEFCYSCLVIQRKRSRVQKAKTYGIYDELKKNYKYLICF